MSCRQRFAGVLVLSISVVASGFGGCSRTEPQQPQSAEPAAAPAASPIPSGDNHVQPGAAESTEVEVDLRNQSLSPEQIDALVSNRSLRRLRVAGSDIDDAAIARLAAGTKLELLDAVDCDQLSGAALASIGSMRSLRNLRLSGPAVNDESIRSLAGLSDLAAVLLQQTELTDRGIEVLAKLPKLRELNLFGSQGVNDAALVVLTELPALEKLRLRGTGVTGDAAAALSRLIKVTELDLSETAFGNAGMPAVAAMPALTQLNLWLTRVDDQGMESLRGKSTLTSLNLDNVSGITDASLSIIAEMPELSFLHLGGTSVTAEGLQQLKSLQKLRTLIITRLGLTPEDVEQVRQLFPGLTKLEA